MPDPSSVNTSPGMVSSVEAAKAPESGTGRKDPSRGRLVSKALRRDALHDFGRAVLCGETVCEAVACHDILGTSNLYQRDGFAFTGLKSN